MHVAQHAQRVAEFAECCRMRMGCAACRTPGSPFHPPNPNLTCMCPCAASGNVHGLLHCCGQLGAQPSEQGAQQPGAQQVTDDAVVVGLAINVPAVVQCRLPNMGRRDGPPSWGLAWVRAPSCWCQSCHERHSCLSDPPPRRSALMRYALISLITIINELFPSYTKIQVRGQRP